MLRRRNGRKDLNYIFPCFRCGEKSALILITLYYLHIYYIYYILCMYLRAAAASDLKIRTHRNGPARKKWGPFPLRRGCARRLGPEVGSRPHP